MDGSFQVLSQKSQSLWVFETGCFLIQNSFFEKKPGLILKFKKLELQVVIKKNQMPSASLWYLLQTSLSHFNLYFTVNQDCKRTISNNSSRPRLNCACFWWRTNLILSRYAHQLSLSSADRIRIRFYGFSLSYGKAWLWNRELNGLFKVENWNAFA